ncbi:protein splicing site [Leptolyngbya sp. NIES-3755]|nr:protein splicing site [Leptolyngbya sp. NIES-3755]
MAVLHGGWFAQTSESQSGGLFLWGEMWRRLESLPVTPGVPIHPYAMSQSELLAFLEPLGLKLPELEAPKRARKTALENWTTRVLALPINGEAPQLSAAPISEWVLHPWKVEGLWLNPSQAFEFLNSLPLGVLGDDSFMGGDLRFWSHGARWALDLLARSKFLPNLNNWEVLLDSSTDQTRLRHFVRQMPSVCRLYQNGEDLALDLPIEPEDLLRDFLNQFIDSQVRKSVTIQRATSLLQSWIQGLGTKATTLNETESKTLSTALMNWKAPLQKSQAQFRACLKLIPPAESYQSWKIEYLLQAIDDSDFTVDAPTIWRNPVEQLNHEGRVIDRPQETLLMGLGLASRLYPLIEPSLQEARPQACLLDPSQAYDFLMNVVWRLQDSGIGVVLPPSLANRGGLANRLGLRIKASTPTKQKKGKLGLQSLLNFEWELSIGGQSLSKKEFDRLVAKNSPLVEINGEWVELRQSDIRSAQSFFAARKDQTTLSLEDALRISTGDTQTIEKLPVVSFEASGALQELVTTLTGTGTPEEIETPKEFKGTLRPYQLRGVSWLKFLEKWGLGACLADDMGLGKCLSNDTKLYVDGELQTAEEIWNQNAGKLAFDGEGFWSEPQKRLLVNSIDETTHKIVTAPIKRLYRQQVQESLRRITLEDGSTVTITRRHHLLTSEGWKNQFVPGDYVCVPSRLVWQGHKEDPDLVKLLAWQISEGYEPTGESSVRITQKDVTVLENLRIILERLRDRYGIKINQPSIELNRGQAADLRVTSVQYRAFLESRGYVWGKRSAEKAIPPFIMTADLDSIQIFLRNYFDAEASVIGSMRSIEISSASPTIINQLSTLLRRFGIWLRISERRKCATNGTRIKRTYYIGTIGGNSARRFLEEIGFGVIEKQIKLQAICATICNTNVEGIPASRIVSQIVQDTKLPIRHFGMHNTVYINGSQQFSRQSLERVVQNMDDIVSGVSLQNYQLLKPSKWTTQTLEAYSELDTTKVLTAKTDLQQLLDQEVFYCRIEKVEDINYEGWVYDFEVEEHHNFVANHILCHNTVQFIAFLLDLKQRKELESPVLLVCPTSVLGNWEREVKKFAPTLKAIVHHGDKRSQNQAFVKAAQSANLIITSYTLVQRDLRTLKLVPWQGIVLDEAQNIKNAEAKQSQAVRELEAEFRIALTGTPVENRLTELWSILDFLNPGYLGQKNFFQRRFAIPIERYGDTTSLQTLRSLTQPFILRRLKTDRSIIQDLPEKQEMPVYCGLSAEQAALYQATVDRSLAEIEAADGIQRKGIILALLTKLKQICNHPALFNKEESLASPRSVKLQRLEEMLEEAVSEGDRALIFTQFAEWGKLLKPHLEQQLGRETLFLYGSTPKKQREEMIDRFQNDPQAPRIFILSLKAGGVGLNLTRANHVFHYDRWWNPAVENQATDRVFRIGQQRNVQVHKFVCTGTLEERIHDMIESKKALAEQVVGTGENWLTELNTDQLRDLLLLDRSAVIED